MNLYAKCLSGLEDLLKVGCDKAGLFACSSFFPHTCLHDFLLDSEMELGVRGQEVPLLESLH